MATTIPAMSVRSLVPVLLAVACGAACDGTPRERWDLEGGHLQATLHTLRSRPWSTANGLAGLRDDRHPGVRIHEERQSGFFFEHVINTRGRDNYRAHFAPDQSDMAVFPRSASEGSLRTYGDRSPWNIDTTSEFSFHEKGIDFAFSATPGHDAPTDGALVFMWASYMAHARERAIHFRGRHVHGPDERREDWQSFGNDTADGIETGAIGYVGNEPLAHDADADSRNLDEERSLRFSLPFYYGLVDGDGDRGTTDDTMVYAMMFDPPEAVRFAVWNFRIDPLTGEPDPTRPAWDWQFVVPQPEPGREYRYRARLVYKPFVDADDVLAEYREWARDLPAP